MRLRDWRNVLVGATLALSGSTASAADGMAPGRSPAEEEATAAPSDDDSTDGEDMPAGHPDVGAGNPRGHGNGAPAGFFQPPEDTEHEDPTLPPGTIAVELRDGDDHPVSHEIVNLGILINSIAKGDSRKHLQGTTDDQGRVVFSGLETASNIAYRVSSGYRGGSFAALPFQMSQGKSMHVVLHVYPITHDTRGTLVVAEATIAAELRDDRIQIEEAINLYNLGRVAWQPDDVTMALPTGYTAFGSQATMGDQGVDDAVGAARLRGTFSPGQHPLEFRWQLPWSGDADVDFSVGLPPHTAIVRLMMPATSQVKLVGKGMPPAEVRQNSQGQSFLVSERRLMQDDAKITSLAIGIHDLPTPGPGRAVATALAALGVLAGIFLATAQRAKSGAAGGDSLRKVLLDELVDLERAHTSGDVGPRTYERVRRELIDALARTLTSPAPVGAHSKAPG
jgi:hypothetical protein